MKLLGIAFLMVNVLLFAWQYNKHVENATREVVLRPALPAGVETLVLLSEMDTLPLLKPSAEDAATGDLSESEVKADVEPADLCLEAGPFSDAVARDGFKDWMADLVAALHTRSETVRKRKLFWVYLEPTSDFGAQKSMVDLRVRGVQDYMLIRRGGLKNAISLGLFSSQDSVNRRLSELEEQGYQPVVVPRYETTDQFWVSAQLAAEYGSLPDIPETLLGDAAAIEIGCDTVTWLSAEQELSGGTGEPVETN